MSRAKTPDWYSPPPVDAATSTVTFPLKTVKIQGITVLPHDKVEALIAPFRGKTVSLADLQGVADKITKLYANAGYGLSFAVVPEQDVENGVVRLVAIEVYIDTITVEMTQRSASFIAASSLSPGAITGGGSSSESASRGSRKNTPASANSTSRLAAIAAVACCQPGLPGGGVHQPVILSNLARPLGPCALQTGGMVG